MLNYDKKVFSVVDFEQVTLIKYLKRKRTLTKKIERSTINAGFKYRQVQCKIYNDPDDGMFNFSKNDFFLIILQSNHELNNEHVLGTFVLQIVFEACMIVIM